MTKTHRLKNNAENYHNLIETSQLYLFDENVGHYVFLNEATEFGKKVLPEITIDKPLVDRKKNPSQNFRIGIRFFPKNIVVN